MATIRTEVLIEARPEYVWSALRDWGSPHERLVPGFVVDTRLEGTDRIVTFFTGMTVRELLVDLDEERHRLVWSVREGPYTHHNGAAEVFPHGDGRTRFVWTADLLPNELAERTAQMMERGTAVIKETMEQPAAGPR